MVARMPIAQCAIDLRNTGTTAPEWLHIMPAGTFKGVDGRGPFTLSDAQAVIAASMARGSIPVDENHATLLATKTGAPSPARGWIVAMEARADGIWARVEWTEAGTELMTGKAYRSLSPVFSHDKGGGVLSILSVALTNNPALPELTTLFTNHQETGMDPVQFRAALGLAETADEAAILAAVTSLAETARGQTVAMTAIATAVGAAEPTQAAIVTALAARQDGTTQIAQMTATITGLETKIQQMTADQARRDATAFVDQAIKDGKPINALRDHYIVRFTADPEGVRKELAALPSIHDGGIKPREAIDPKDVDLTAEDKHVIQAMGLDPDAYRRTKAGLVGPAEKKEG